MAHQKVIKELREDCHCEGEEFCPLEQLVRSFNDRLLEQHNCVRLYKWNLGKVTWNEAYLSWVEKGYATRFAEEYKEELTWKEIYSKVIERR